jgi:HD-like signal output (HDOD) protein/ActR/RegA family two-component response regulator
MSSAPSQPAVNRKRILFVDDDGNVLDGLRNVLRSQRHEWDMVFALGPEKALALLAEQSFDVVVSDMRMPQMDGAALLAEVKRLQPQAVRMILTGQTEQESVMKSVFVAHLFLSKPCDHVLLKGIVGRAFSLNTILNSEDLRAAAGQVDMLPSPPRTYVALNEALTCPNCSVGDLAKIIERDIGLCAKILQLVNSAFFGLPRRIGSLTEAITYIGTQTIKTLALALEAFSGGSRPGAFSASELLTLQEHSVLAGQIARRINSRDKNKAEEAFLAGVLHEVGRLIQVPSRSKSERPFDHALLGAYLLGLWGLPHPITEAVAYHREPRLLAHSEFELVDAVYIAHHLATELMGSPKEQDIDLDHLATVGMSREQFEQVSATAREMAMRSSA